MSLVVSHSDQSPIAMTLGCLLMTCVAMRSMEGTSLWDPVTMAMLELTPIHRLDGNALYADDSAAGSSLERHRDWWDLLEEIGPLCGYFRNDLHPNQNRACRSGQRSLSGTGITISAGGRRYLGGGMGTTPFLQQFIRRKVQEWTEEIKILSQFATTQPLMRLSRMGSALGGIISYGLLTGKNFRPQSSLKTGISSFQC